MKNINKFIISGSDSVEPRPKFAYDTEESAIEQAKKFLNNKDCTQEAVIIWKPFMVVRRTMPPIEVLTIEQVITQQQSIETSEDQNERLV